MLRKGLAQVWFDAGGDSEDLLYVHPTTGELTVFSVRMVTFKDGREPLFYTVDAFGEATSPAMPSIAMQALLDARQYRVTEYLKTLH
jgi:hypothetical protein